MSNKQIFLNNFDTQFAAAVNAAPSSNSPNTELDYGVLRISPGSAGALFGVLESGDWFIMTAFKRAGAVESNVEIIKVLAVDASMVNEVRLTVLRGQEGTVPQSYVAGDYLSMRATAGGLKEFVQNSDPRLSGVPSGVAGGVLGGSYPNPGFAVDMATKAQLDAAISNVTTTLTGKESAVAAGSISQYWRGDKNWRDLGTDVRSVLMSGLSSVASAAVVAGDTLLNAIAKLQAQVDAKEPSIAAGTTEQYLTGGKNWRDFYSSVRATVLTGFASVTASSVIATDTVFSAIQKLQAQFSLYIPLSGGTFTGPVVTKALAETRVAMLTNNIDLSEGNVFSKTINGAATFTVTNIPSAGSVGVFIFDLTNGGSATITWWSGIKWPSGSPPTLTAFGRDMLGFITHDGGVTWSGFLLGKALA